MLFPLYHRNGRVLLNPKMFDEKRYNGEFVNASLLSNTGKYPGVVFGARLATDAIALSDVSSSPSVPDIPRRQVQEINDCVFGCIDGWWFNRWIVESDG